MVLLVASVIVGVGFGAAGIAPFDVLRVVASHFGVDSTGIPATSDAIVWELRLPRVLTALFVGAGLGLCGSIMQAVTRNPLADPYLLGLSSGASVGAAAVIVLGWDFVLPVAAFAGAVLALAATLALAGPASGGIASGTRTVLAGVAVSALLSAATSLMIFLSATGDTYREILGWLLGSLGGADWGTVLVAGCAVVIIGVPLLVAARPLDVFAYGDLTARSLGVHVGRVRWILLAACALLTGVLVSVSGSIGFVGLVVPHAVRLVVGHAHRIVLPMSAVVGALLVVWADTLARTVVAPREIPVGVVTALLGAPAFAILLIRVRKPA
ncbi:iron chelate uptake ABC transporter family permease subunit [Microbacterium sp. GXS0129]|uniref:iron chelate uptake ABC transporter family permease subunit n=1 Tax=Microbacterium sp. GXS0129 TaxID=3377836 RepID=UPI00383B4DE0